MQLILRSHRFKIRGGETAPISLLIEDRLLRIDVVLQDLSPINQPWVLILLRDGRDYPRSLGALLAWFGTDEDWPVLPGVVAMAGRVRLR